MLDFVGKLALGLLGFEQPAESLFVLLVVRQTMLKVSLSENAHLGPLADRFERDYLGPLVGRFELGARN
jgi:hypothetical protein